MNTDSTNREEELFDAARRMTESGARRAFLESECGGDGRLRGRVEALLSSSDEADRFFAESTSALIAIELAGERTRGGTPMLPRDWAEGIGTRIDRYKLVQKVGEGGCGVVYLAEQEEPVRRRVALKIIRLGMESHSVIARFEAERQALAMMDHPNIARVFDAGETERGSPYFVMEYVQGVKITSYCDQHRLPIRQRLDLFIQICHAIQHAHQKGIVHGDIKPSNIIVSLHDGIPIPKVIDFGISKATEGRFSDATASWAGLPLVGTPAYMSPEQMEMGGLDVDTRSDIYSLGVLLYELLTGRTPFDAQQLLKEGVEAMRSRLYELDAVRPSLCAHELDPQELGRVAQVRGCRGSRLIALLRGDLDGIVLKALEKDRRRRYETANGFALDVQRHLVNEPVMARPSRWGYRLQKLVRRNRGVFAAGGAVAVALIMGTGVSTWLFLKEREARQRAVAAEQQQTRLRQEAEKREQVTQAALLVSQERFAEADRLLDGLSLTDATLEGAAVFRALGEWHALNERWREAADRFGILLRVNQLDGADVTSLDYLERGPALIELGDVAAYERFRQEAIIRFADGSPHFAERVVKISLLTPANDRLLEDLEPYGRVAREAYMEAASSGQAFEAAWRAMSLGLLAYRTGNYSDAVSWCERCLSSPDFNAPRMAAAQAILAMAQARLGRESAAGMALEAAREMMESRTRGRRDRGTPVQGFWFDWAFARILLREGEQQIEELAPRS